MKKLATYFLLAVMLYCTWPNQCTKSIPQHLFGAIYLVRTYLMTDFLTPLPLYAPVHISDDPPPSPQLCTYLMKGLFLNHKTNNKIWISYLLKYKHWKKEKVFKSYTGPKILHLISARLSHISGIIIVHFKSYLSQCF